MLSKECWGHVKYTGASLKGLNQSNLGKTVSIKTKNVRGRYNNHRINKNPESMEVHINE